jgi:hypothetical protein
LVAEDIAEVGNRGAELRKRCGQGTERGTGDGGRRFRAAEPVEKSARTAGEARIGGVACVVLATDALSEGIERGQQSNGCWSHANHGHSHQHSARAAIPVQETHPI